VAILLDTSVLIGAERGPEDEAAISVVSLTELHFGVLVAPNEEARANRVQRLGIVESHFDALPFDAAAARECGRLHAAVAQRGGQPRRRALDLAIAATANVHGVPLLTYNSKDFQIIDDLVDVRTPRP
jgi:toxin FitB